MSSSSSSSTSSAIPAWILNLGQNTMRDSCSDSVPSVPSVPSDSVPSSSRTISFPSVQFSSRRRSTFGSMSLSSSLVFGWFSRCYPIWVTECFHSPDFLPGFHNRNRGSLSALSSLSLNHAPPPHIIPDSVADHTGYSSQWLMSSDAQSVQNSQSIIGYNRLISTNRLSDKIGWRRLRIVFNYSSFLKKGESKCFEKRESNNFF